MDDADGGIQRAIDAKLGFIIEQVELQREEFVKRLEAIESILKGSQGSNAFVPSGMKPLPTEPKKYKQSVLNFKKPLFPVSPKEIDLSQIPGYTGGERRIKNSGGSPTFALPISSASTSAGEKSHERSSPSRAVTQERSSSSPDRRLRSPSPSQMPLSPTIKRRPFSSPPVALVRKSLTTPTVARNNEEVLMKDEDETHFVESDEEAEESQDVYPPTPPTKKPNLPLLLSRKRKQDENLPSTMDVIADFDKIPVTVEKEPNFAYKPLKAVRKKEERQKLPGWDCPSCRAYYEGMASQMEPAELQKLKNACSKHRSKFQEPEYLNNTPENFWRMDFPSTQECLTKGLLLEGKRSPPKPKRVPINYY